MVNPRSRVNREMSGSPREPDFAILRRNYLGLNVPRVGVNQKVEGVKGALWAEVKRLGVSYNPNDETLSRDSLMYMSNANLPIAVD